MMTCKACGNEVPAGSVYCNICGVRLTRGRPAQVRAGGGTEITVPKPRQLVKGGWRIGIMLKNERHYVRGDTEEECIAEAVALKKKILSQTPSSVGARKLGS